MYLPLNFDVLIFTGNLIIVRTCSDIYDVFSDICEIQDPGQRFSPTISEYGVVYIF